MTSTRKRWFIAAVLFFMVALVTLLLLESPSNVDTRDEPKNFPSVSYVEVKPQDLASKVQSFAEIKPLWDTVIKAQNTGRIIEVFDAAFAGQQVSKGQVLIDIESSQYLANLEEARRQVAEAKLNLALEENKATQAVTDWKAADVDVEVSDLALNIPQQAAAQKALIAAQSQEAAALVQYQNTHVKVPFSGVIRSRYVSLGQTVYEGDELFQIQNNNTLEIEVLINRQQQEMLTENWSDQKAKIFDTTGKFLAHAKIARNNHLFDPETRQYKIFLTANQNASKSLIVGDFVKIELPGKTHQSLLAIPDSALSGDGYVWYIDHEDKLRRFFASVRFYQDGFVMIDTPSLAISADPLRIAVTPLTSYLSSMKVNPVLADTATQEP